MNSSMQAYVVIDRYITAKYHEIVKTVGYFNRYDDAFDCAMRKRRVLNRLHDLIIIPMHAAPRDDWEYLRGYDYAAEAATPPESQRKAI